MQNDIVRQPPQPTPEPPVEAPAEPSVTDVPAPSPVQPESPAVSETEEKQSSQEPPKKPKSNRPTGVIVAAIIVFLALSGGVIYGTMQKTNEDTKEAIPVVMQGQPVEQKARAGTAQDVTDTISEIEASSSQPTDMSADLSDQTLGL